MYRHFFKRFFDFWMSVVALVCISPVLIVVMVWLHFANKGAGAFFTQERPGNNSWRISEIWQRYVSSRKSVCYLYL